MPAHTPFTTAAERVAEQDAFDPVPEPLQVHVYVVGFVVTADVVPALQKFTVGGVVLPNVPPCDAPHTAFTMMGAEQDAFDPPPEPLHVQSYVPAFVVTDGVDPSPHRLVVGGVELPNVPPCDVPHVPLTREEHEAST